MEAVAEAFSRLKSGKADGSTLDSSHFKLACPVLKSFVSSLFTATYVATSFLAIRDCTLVPVPKPGSDPTSRDPTSRDPTSRDPTSRDPTSRDPTKADNYRPIALASTLSKVLEWCILFEYGEMLARLITSLASLNHTLHWHPKACCFSLLALWIISLCLLFGC